MAGGSILLGHWLCALWSWEVVVVAVVSRYLDKYDNFASHVILLVEFSEIFRKCTKKSFFEKSTQK